MAIYVPLGCDVLDCDTNDLRPAFIQSDTMKRMAEGPGWMIADLSAFGPSILECPVVVFEGLNRPGFNGVDFGCYCGTVPNAPQAGVLVIFVREPKGFELSGPIVFSVEWRQEDPSRSGFPLGWSSDFGRVKHDRNNCL